MTDIQKTPFVRELASSDRRTRDKALESLTMFLKMKTGLSLVDLLKVWKGLFFCFYHSDRPLTQQSLARSLSYSIVPSLPHSTLHRFLRAFWITIGRDFHKIDRLRLDKYLYLIRCYVGVAFEVFIKNNNKSSTKQNNDKKSANGGKDKKRKRDEGSMTTEKNKKKKKRTTTKTDANGTTHEEDEKEEEEEESTNLDSHWTDLESYISIIEEGPLHPLNFDPNEPTSTSINTDSDVTMPHGPDGLRYHILDIWLDELEKVVEVEDLDVDSSNNTDGPTKRLKGDIPMDLILRPMRKLKAESPTKTVRERAGEVLEDDRLVEWGVIERKKGSDDEDEEEDSEEEWGGLGDD